MQLTVTADVSRLKLDMARERARLARVSRRVVNAAAFTALDAVQAEMERVFDRPTPWVKRGMYVVPARDGDALREPVEARLDWRFSGNKSGVTAKDVLRAQIEGGARRQKGFEALLARSSWLPAGMIAVPGRHAPLDAYGNIPGAFIVRVLSDLQLFGEVGYLMNRSMRRRPGRRLRRARFFVVRPNDDRPQFRSFPAGIYDSQGPGGAPLLVIAFVRAARYRPRFSPGQVGARAAQVALPTLWNQGLAGTLPFRRAR